MHNGTLISSGNVTIERNKPSNDYNQWYALYVYNSQVTGVNATSTWTGAYSGGTSSFIDCNIVGSKCGIEISDRVDMYGGSVTATGGDYDTVGNGARF